jgi:hypothetical protein
MGNQIFKETAAAAADQRELFLNNLWVLCLLGLYILYY